MYVTTPFLLTSLVVIVTPGPDLILITRLVIEHKRRSPACAAAAGMISAGVLHLCLGLAGLTVLLTTDPLLFTVLRWAGAAALFGWGLAALRSALKKPSKPPATQEEAPVERRAGNTYLQGMLCTGSNPKVALFLVALLSQFVPEGARPLPALLILGGVYLSMGLVWLLVWITVAYEFRRHMVLSSSVLRGAEFLLCFVFTYFGIKLLVT
jgi:threonine/homoserine/homoserine lactone efflux protein